MVLLPSLLMIALGALALCVHTWRVAQKEFAARSLSAQTEMLRLREQLRSLEQSCSAQSAQMMGLREAHGRNVALLAAATERAERAEQAAAAIAMARDKLSAERMALTELAAELRTTLDAERAHAGEKLHFLAEAKEQMAQQFKAVASDVLEDKRKSFSEHSQATLGALLTPFGTQMETFKKSIDELHTSGTKERAELNQQFKTTLMLNQSLAKGAEELARALKGSNKTQGNWGELVLQNILESSGLRAGVDYAPQHSMQRDDGTRGQPDIIIKLPEQRHLIIDSKMSLTAYQEAMNADADALRVACLDRHVDSMRAHIKGLSAKNYQALHGVHTLDFVLLFVPVEPAFITAVAHDSSLFDEAWKKNIILVSPSTLMFVLRTVASLWRQEHQNQNAREIAQRGAELYDKLAGFVAEFDKVGRNLSIAQSTFVDARSKLTAGRGNVLQKAEQLRDLGVKPSKQLARSAESGSAEEEDLSSARLSS